MKDAFPFSAVVGQEEAALALVLAAIDPSIGGVLLRGEKGSAKTTLARGLAGLLPDYAPFVELPVGATEDRVLGSLDLRAALHAGDVERFRPGLLAAAHGGVLYVDEVNLLPDHIIDAVLDAAASGTNRVERDGVSHEHPARFVLLGSMNPEEGELRPQLLDRFGLCVEVRSPDDPVLRAEAVRRRLAHDAGQPVPDTDDELRQRLAAARPAMLPNPVVLYASRVAAGIGAESLRADLVLCRAARALAGWEGRATTTEDDIASVAPLVLAHRRRRRPFDPPVLPPEDLDAALAEADRMSAATAPGSADEDEGYDDEYDTDDAATDPDADPEIDGYVDDEGHVGSAGSPGPDGSTSAPDGYDDLPDDAVPGGPFADGEDTEEYPTIEPGTATPTLGTPLVGDEVPGEVAPLGGDPLRADAPAGVPTAAPAPAASGADAGSAAGAAGVAAPLPDQSWKDLAGGSFEDEQPPLDLGLPARPRPGTVEGPGRAVGHRAPSGGGAPDELAVLPTVRAAVRRRASDPSGPVLAEEDLREPRRVKPVGRIIVLAVDTSGSMGTSERVSAATGAVMGLLADAYLRRDKVALVTFRDEEAVEVLPPTASVELARAKLAELETGGPTPLAEGITAALDTAQRSALEGGTPLLVLLTDGRPTGARGGLDRAMKAAEAVRSAGIEAVILDAEGDRDRLELAAELAEAMGGRNVRLSDVSAAAVEIAIRKALTG